MPSDQSTILVVDDSDVDRKVVTAILSKAGYRVVEAHNGEEGLRAAHEHIPDLIILDCDMPIMTGQEMCERLKDQEVTEEIPVLFLTSLNTPKNVIDCFELDAENFLSKPVNSKILITQVQAILDI